MKNEELKVILFYKFANIPDPEKFVREHLRHCKKLGIMGRVLVSNEGINGSVSGTVGQIENYKKNLRNDSRFSGIVFKEDPVIEHPFTKMKVKVRNEIVTFGEKVDISKTGKHIQPEDLKKMYDSGEEFIVLDARNDYEYKVGKFKNAIHLDIKNFRDFPKELEKLENYKDKKIVAYCTGGIRCEKATAYMKEKGFENVMQLNDGILNFGKQFPDTYWEGKCFVFDKRLVAPINSKEDTIASCEVCSKPSDLCRNCRNLSCDKLIVECLDCQKKLNGCCSEKCLVEFRAQCMEKAIRKQGRRVEL